MKTTYYLIRHAEKDRCAGANPNLLPIGRKRAKFWAKIFKDKNIDLVYSTDYKRTLQTGAPTAKNAGTEVRIYNQNEMYSDEFKFATQGKTVLIIGHQDTTPKFANTILGEEKFSYIPSGSPP